MKVHHTNSFGKKTYLKLSCISSISSSNPRSSFFMSSFSSMSSSHRVSAACNLFLKDSASFSTSATLLDFSKSISNSFIFKFRLFLSSLRSSTVDWSSLTRCWSFRTYTNKHNNLTLKRSVQSSLADVKLSMESKTNV